MLYYSGSLMKNLVFIFLALMSLSVRAECYDFAHYSDDNLFINISDGGCSSSVKIYISHLNAPNSDYHLEFDNECKRSEDKNLLTCRANQKNPLSGVTYKRFQKGFEECPNLLMEDKYPAYVLRCVNGCNNAPKELKVSYACD